MPSRVRSIDLDALVIALKLVRNVDYPLVEKGREVQQIGIVTLPSAAAGLLGIRVGPEGDALRLNAQGQVLNLTGKDTLEGVWLVWMGSGVANPGGVVELALGTGGSE